MESKMKYVALNLNLDNARLTFWPLFVFILKQNLVKKLDEVVSSLPH